MPEYRAKLFVNCVICNNSPDYETSICEDVTKIFQDTFLNLPLTFLTSELECI